MAGVCTSSTRANGAGCDHRLMAVDHEGVTLNLKSEEATIDAADWDSVIPRAWARKTCKELYTLLGIKKRLRMQSIALDNAVGRVCNGEEATNVKQYDILAKDVTLTNMRGAANDTYIDVPPGANGERYLVDFTGCTQFELVVHAVMNGSGTYRLRIVRDSDSAVLHESASINAAAGEREFDTGILSLPAAANGLFFVRFQAKSSANTNDPIFRSCRLLVK